MALKPCRECDNTVSTSATSCPHCGVRSPTAYDITEGKKQIKRNQTNVVILKFFGIFFAFLLVANFFLEREAQSRPSASELEASINVSDNQLVIENLNGFDWRNCDVALNRRWSQRITYVRAFGEVSAGLATFTASDGARFNPVTHAATSVRLVCDTPNGWLTWIGQR